MRFLLEGFLVALGLIVAIGAQNAYILKQGLKKEHVFPLIFICSLIDAILIFCGVKGLGVIIAKSELFLLLVTIFGVLFLLGYGILSLKSAFKDEALIIKESNKSQTLKKAVLSVLALTLLNPHVYLDTFLLIGSIGGGHSPINQNLFIIGACSASFFWFFSLGYGSRALIPLFKKPKTWKILDFCIALVMFFIAGGLILRVV